MDPRVLLHLGKERVKQHRLLQMTVHKGSPPLLESLICSAMRAAGGRLGAGPADGAVGLGVGSAAGRIPRRRRRAGRERVGPHCAPQPCRLPAEVSRPLRAGGLGTQASPSTLCTTHLHYSV